MRLGFFAGLISPEAIPGVLHKIFADLGDKTIEAGAQKAGSAISLRVHGKKSSVPLNHDLLRALRRAWLKTLHQMARDLEAIANNDPNLAESKLLKQTAALQRACTWQINEWSPESSKSAKWLDIKASAILKFYEAAADIAADVEGNAHSPDLAETQFRAIALADIATLLEIDHSLIDERLANAVNFGWEAIGEGSRDFSQTVTAFLLEEIKTDGKARVAHQNLVARNLRDRVVENADSLAKIIAEAGLENLRASERHAEIVGHFQGLVPAIGDIIEESSERMLSSFVDTNRQLLSEELGRVKEHFDRTVEVFTKTISTEGDHVRENDRLLEVERAQRAKIETALAVLPGERLTLSTPMELADDQIVLLRRRAASTTPTFRQLRAGLYLPRPDRLESARSSFEAWNRTSDPLKIDSFWIEGRSGDGKSLLMLQLVERLLVANPDAIFYRIDADELPDWLALTAKLPKEAPALYAVIDDLPNLKDEDGFVRKLARLLDAASPRGRVITCAIKAQISRIGKQWKELFAFHKHLLGPPSAADRSALADWLNVDRTQDAAGKDARFVEIAFTLALESPEAFARRFWAHARQEGVERSAASLLALNAIDLEGTENEVCLPADRDALRDFLEAEGCDIETFVTKGVRLFHGQMAWLVLCENAGRRQPHTYWARMFGQVLDLVADQRDFSEINQLLRAALRSSRFIDMARSAHPRASFDDVLREWLEDSTALSWNSRAFIAIQMKRFAMQVEIVDLKEVLPSIEKIIDDLTEKPEAHPSAAALVAVDRLQSAVPPSISSRTSKQVDEDWQARVTRVDVLAKVSAALQILRHPAVRKQAGSAFGWIIGSYRPLPALLLTEVKDFVQDLGISAQSAPLLAPLLSAPQTKEWAFSHVLAWLEVNAERLEAFNLLLQCYSILPESDRMPLVERWISKNGQTRIAGQLLDVWAATLERRKKPDPKSRKLLFANARAWLSLHSSVATAPGLILKLLHLDPNARDLNASLQRMAKSPNLHIVLEARDCPLQPKFFADLARQWILANLDHPSCSNVLSIAGARDPMIVARAVLVTTLPRIELANASFGALLSVMQQTPTQEWVLDVLLEWVRFHPDRPQTFTLVNALLDIPALTQVCGELVSVLAALSQDARRRRVLVWSMLKVPRLLRGAGFALADVVAEHFHGDEQRAMIQAILQEAVPDSGVPARLMQQLIKHRPDFYALSILLVRVIEKAPRNSTLLTAASAWLATRKTGEHMLPLAMN